MVSALRATVAIVVIFERVWLMNSWILVYLGGPVGEDLIIYNSFPTLDAAIAAQITTGTPWNYRPCQVWGPPVTPSPFGTPQDPYTPQTVADGAWIAITSGVTVYGLQSLFGYGTFASRDAAKAWSRSQTSPGNFSFGLVQLTA